MQFYSFDFSNYFRTGEFTPPDAELQLHSPENRRRNGVNQRFGGSDGVERGVSGVSPPEALFRFDLRGGAANYCAPSGYFSGYFSSQMP